MNAVEPAISPVILLSADDDVLIARVPLAAGTLLPGYDLHCTHDIPAGHKIALRPLATGAPVHRYGQVIGTATMPIAAGEHVHVHNLGMDHGSRLSPPGSRYKPTDFISTPAFFEGFVRADGSVGTRNMVGILTSVNCSATVAKRIAAHFSGEIMARYPHVDGVVALTHSQGCGMASEGEGMDVLRRTIAGYARHSNFAGVLLVGLGCESNQIEHILRSGAIEQGPQLRTFTIQQAGGTLQAITRGIEQVGEMLQAAEQARRTPVPARHITLGLQCGGSDGYSGISANPALGAAVDLLVRHGGTAILSETPEIYGAEHLLLDRAASPEVAARLARRLQWWEAYTKRNGGEMNNNPSPGNKAGGLTTILEKSLGAVTKGGTSGLMDVVEYAQSVRTQGLVFMDTPGYDPVSATGQVAGGANLICFTTGRGSVFGCKPVPSIKLATNSELFRNMNDDMDINCGGIIDGSESVGAVGARIFEMLLRVASGEQTKSEVLGMGEAEFAPWQLGAVM